jgi:hypothetical protein
MKLFKNRVEYYQEINCFSYYTEGNLHSLKEPISIYMISLTDSGMVGITSSDFKVLDVLMLNIHVDKIPFDKLMGNIKIVECIGDMNKIEVEFMGMPNALFDRIKAMLVKQGAQKSITFEQSEIEVLQTLVKKLKG